MKITDTTPKPVERTFTIELTENELKNITLILGNTDVGYIKSVIEDNGWQAEVLGGMTYVPTGIFYDKFKDAITNK